MDHHGFILLIFYYLCFLSVSSIRLPSLGDDKLVNGSTVYISDSKLKFDPTRAIQLSWRPRTFLYEKFLSEKECDHLINLAKKGKLEKSMVADSKTGESVESEIRTSTGMFLNKAQDEIVHNIETRIAQWTFLPIENGEDLQILHYEHGQKYETHCDFFKDKSNQILGGQRVATVLMYLSNVEKGGETVFPFFEPKLPQLKDESLSECAREGYAVKPKKGDALLFFGLHLNTTEDFNSLHGSCPVIEGEKWSATKWIHVSDFEKPYGKLDNGDCVDKNMNCPKWAKLGECEKNPSYMIRSGKCLKSCNVCSSKGGNHDFVSNS